MRGIRGSNGAFRAALATCGLFFFTTVDAVSEHGLLEIRITDHAPAIEKFGRLDVRIAQVSLHKKGRKRQQGWHDLLDSTPTVDIVPLKNGIYRSLGERPIELGHYDAVRVRFAAASGAIKDGDESPVVLAHDGVVAMEIDIDRRTNRPLVIDLYAEDQTEHCPARYVVKIKEIRNHHSAAVGDNGGQKNKPWTEMRLGTR